MIRKAIIPVAGKGTRMQPITNIMAKEMLPIGTIPTLDYVVQEAVDSGIEQILFVLSTTKGMVANYFAGTPTPVTYDKGGRYEYNCRGKAIQVCFTYQGTKVGSGGAVLYGREFAKREPIAVLFGDDIIMGNPPAIRQLMDISAANGYASVLGVQRQPESVLRTVGVIKPKIDNGTWGIVEQIVEKPQGDLPSNVASLGRFILSDTFFEVLARTPRNRGEVWLTEALGLEARERDVLYACFTGNRYDIGNKFGYIRAFCDLAILQDSEGYNNYISHLDTEE